MKKGILALAVGAAALGGGAYAGLYYTGETVDHTLENLQIFVNQQQDLALSVTTTESSLLTRHHELSLFVQGTEIRLEQTVKLQPWGATGDIKLIQEGELFDSLRQETTFRNLPLTTNWVASGLSNRLDAEMNLRSLSIKEIDQGDTQIQLSPSQLVVSMPLDGSEVATNLYFGGMDIQAEGLELTIKDLKSVSRLSAINDGLMVTHSDFTLASLRVTEESLAGQTRLSASNVSMLSTFTDAETGTVTGHLKADELAFVDPAQGMMIPVNLAGSSLGFTMKNLDMQALALMDQAGLDPVLAEQMTAEALEIQLAKGLTLEIDAKIDDVLLQGEPYEGFNLAGEINMAPSDLQTIQYGDGNQLRELFSGRADLAVSEPLAKLSPLPLELLVLQGLIVEEPGRYTSNLRLEKGVLIANDQVLPF